MLGIIRLNDDNFKVQANSVISSVLSMKELFQLMISLDTKFEEIELAVSELVNNNHNVAEFGVNRNFIFSK